MLFFDLFYILIGIMACVYLKRWMWNVYICPVLKRNINTNLHALNFSGAHIGRMFLYTEYTSAHYQLCRLKDGRVFVYFLLNIVKYHYKTKVRWNTINDGKSNSKHGPIQPMLPTSCRLLENPFSWMSLASYARLSKWRAD